MNLNQIRYRLFSVRKTISTDTLFYKWVVRESIKLWYNPIFDVFLICIKCWGRKHGPLMVCGICVPGRHNIIMLFNYSNHIFSGWHEQARVKNTYVCILCNLYRNFFLLVWELISLSNSSCFKMFCFLMRHPTIRFYIQLNCININNNNTNNDNNTINNMPFFTKKKRLNFIVIKIVIKMVFIVQYIPFASHAKTKYTIK